MLPLRSYRPPLKADFKESNISIEFEISQMEAATFRILAPPSSVSDGRQ